MNQPVPKLKGRRHRAAADGSRRTPRRSQASAPHPASHARRRSPTSFGCHPSAAAPWASPARRVTRARADSVCADCRTTPPVGSTTARPQPRHRPKPRSRRRHADNPKSSAAASVLAPASPCYHHANRPSRHRCLPHAKPQARGPRPDRAPATVGKSQYAKRQQDACWAQTAEVRPSGAPRRLTTRMANADNRNPGSSS